MDYIIIRVLRRLDARRFALDYARTTPLRDSLYTFPSISLGAWLGIVLNYYAVKEFPEFTSFFNLPFDKKLPSDSEPLYR